MDVTFQGSPRPVPIILPDTPFSQRKRTPFRAQQPPMSPAKSCPPISRVFKTAREPIGPQTISFKPESKDFSSPLYNSQVKQSYFEQCFDVLEKLGQGSFGEVFKVRSRENGKLYAVKKSRQRFRGKLDRRQKLTEVEKHERLPRHLNCVQFHKAWEERQCLYIQIELCEMNLTEYADLHGRLPENRVWRILIDLLRGLKHLHNHKLCHFDIKPANIFLGEDGVTCKLGDFGLCVSEEQDFPNAMEGDSKYMAPELMKGKFGKPADVFSLGISMLELACDLELPSDGRNWHLLRTSQLPTEFTRDLSSSLVNILSRMMNPDPDQRPTVNQLLSESSVRLETVRHCVCDVCSAVVTGCKAMLRGLYSLILFIAALFSAGTKLPMRDDLVGDTNTPTFPPSTLSQINDSFSDDDEGLAPPIDPVDPKATFNKSWIQNSPVRYPSPLYSGPPIPLDFDDSSGSCDASPEKSYSLRSSPHPRNNLQNSSSSRESSFSLTPRSKCSVISENSSLNRSILIEPKNLMEAFGEPCN